MKGSHMIAHFDDERFAKISDKKISHIGQKRIAYPKHVKKLPTDFDVNKNIENDKKRINELVGEVFGFPTIKSIRKASPSMGNVCILNQNTNVQKVSSSPHNLEELLSGIVNPEEISSDNVESVIDSNSWTSSFKEYLNKRNLEDELTILKFLVMVQAIRTKSINKKTPKELYMFKSKKVLDICETFFSEDSENQVPLSNQHLWMEISAMTNSLKAGLPVSEEALDDVIKARKDPAVWDEGLEPKFINFAKQAPGPTLKACLLSIL